MATHSTIEGFQADLRRFAKQIDADLEKVVRRVALSLLVKITLRTPVDTGRARASWIITANEPDRTTVAPEGGGGSPGLSSVPEVGPYGAYWITNNLPYIRVLEFGGYPGDGPKTTGGFSQQAPQGMVRVSIAEVDAELAAELHRRS